MTPPIMKFAELPRGLVLVTGPVYAVPQLMTAYGDQMSWSSAEANAMGGTGIAVYRGNGSFSIVSGYKLHVERSVRETVPFVGRAPRNRTGCSSPAMEALLQRNNFAAAGLLKRHPQSIFIGFCTAVHEEHPVQTARSKLNQLVSCLSAHFQSNRIALEK